MMQFRPVRDRAPRVSDRPAGFAPWVRALRGQSGAYLIRNRFTGAVAYAGESHTGRLYETFTRHFQRWKGPTAGPTFSATWYDGAAVITPAAKAVAKQDALIRRHKPPKNVVANPAARPAPAEDDGDPF